MKSSILYYGILVYMLIIGCESKSNPLIPEIKHIAGIAAVVGNEPFHTLH